MDDKNRSSIVRLSSIKEIMNQGKHALIDVTPNAVDKLNYAQLYPIVIFTRTESKQTIKDCRAGIPKWVLVKTFVYILLPRQKLYYRV